MKYTYRTIALALCLILGITAKAQEKKITINGKFSKWDRGPVALLYSENNDLKQDTMDVVKGKFTFKVKIKTPSRLAIYSIAAVHGQTKDNVSFYADKGIITLKGSDSLTHATIKGSQITQEGLQLNRNVSPIQNKLVALRIKASGLSKEDPNYETEINELNGEYKALINDINSTKTSFIKSHPNSYLSLITLNEFMGGAIDYNFVSPLLSGVSADLKKTSLAKEMEQKLLIAKRTSPGEFLPDFTSKDTAGNALALSTIVAKGKVTLVDFWASWCLPCRKENPNIVKAFNAFQHKGFNILSVSLDKSESAWKKAINDDGMPWYHVSSLQYWDEPAAKLYGISGIPDSFLLDAEGRVLARGLRAEDLYKRLQELLD